MPEDNLLPDFYGAREDNRGRHTNHPGGHNSILTNQQPTSIIPPYLCQMPFLPQPFHFILAWDRHQICWIAYPVKCFTCDWPSSDKMLTVHVNSAYLLNVAAGFCRCRLWIVRVTWYLWDCSVIPTFSTCRASWREPCCTRRLTAWCRVSRIIPFIWRTARFVLDRRDSSSHRSINRYFRFSASELLNTRWSPRLSTTR